MLLTAEDDALTGCRWISPSADNIESIENPIISEAIREIKEYLAGLRKEFNVPIRPQGTLFRMKVWEELQRIPYGETVTYGELARRIGNPNATRAVANACGANPLPILIPCHRVVASGGKTGGYTGGLDIKLTLLELENKTIRKGVVLSDK